MNNYVEYVTFICNCKYSFNYKNLIDTVKLAISDLDSAKSKMINSFNYAEINFSQDTYHKNLIDIIDRYMD